MVFLSGVDDIVGMPIAKGKPARIVKPVPPRIPKATPARIAKPIKAKIAKPIKAKIAVPWYMRGDGNYTYSGFGDVDEITGVPIDAAIAARIATPPPPSIPPGPSGEIPSAIPARIRRGPSGEIARGPGGDSDSSQGMRISRGFGPINITGPTAVLPAFPVPGAGEEAKSLSSPPIVRGPSGAIPPLAKVSEPTAKQAGLAMVRDRLGPVIDALAELPANERGPALREALTLFGQPNAEPAVRRLTAEFIAKGTQPQIAFREALARVMATAIFVVAPAQVLAAQGVSTTSLQGFTGLGGKAWYEKAWDGVKSGAKAVGKAAVKVVHKINDLVEDVACSSVGKAAADAAATAFTGAPPGTGGAASCASAKMNEYLTAELAHAVGVKKKNPSFKSAVKSIGGEIVKGVGAAARGAGGMTQIKLPVNLQSVADTVRSKVNESEVMTIARTELEKRVPDVKKLSKKELDVVLTQVNDRNATPEAYGDKPRDTVLVGTPPKKSKPREKSAYEQALEAAKQREAAKTPEQRAAEKAEGERWRKENEWRYASSAANPNPIRPLVLPSETSKPKSSKVPLILLGGVAVGALAYVLMKRRAQ